MRWTRWRLQNCYHSVWFQFSSNGKLDDSWQSGSVDFASSPAGLLRITRDGSTITTSYYEDSSWNPLKSFTGAFTEDAEAQISVYTGDDGNFFVSCDYIEYVGQLVGWLGSWLLLLLGDWFRCWNGNYAIHWSVQLSKPNFCHDEFLIN